MSERLRALLHRRALVGVAAILALAGLIVASTGAAANQPEPAGGTDGLIDPVWTPLGVSGAPQTLMVQLSGAPVTVVEANSGGKLNKAEKAALRAQLAGRQNALKGSIEGLGGRILGDYQLAYNGIKVSISPSKTAQVEQLPGVLAVRAIQSMEPDNIRGVPYIGAPAVWDGLAGLHGEGIKIAVIDTGIDYTHANFGGPGTVAAYFAANATDTVAADPVQFGPLAAKVKGGFDFVGDAYNAASSAPPAAHIPHPDPNPLDCFGHGSHVAGSAAGFGVLDNGATYTGAYNPTTISGNSWRIAPGVAPKADLYALRVFGCAGSTNVTVDAIEWAVEHDMDVINMSLGSAFGTKDDPSAVASTNAAKAGVIVVTSAGNNGPNQYITGSPGTAEGAISTAAQDAWPTTPGATLTVTPTITGSPFTLINANGADWGASLTGNIVVLQDNPATTTDETGFIGSADESLGCSPAAYTFNGVVSGGGQIAVAKRGTCARVARAIFGQQAGAAAVIMTNNAAGRPPFEGLITSNPDTGVPFVVTIPFLGADGNQDAAGTPSSNLRANGNGKSGLLVPVNLTNTNFTGFASFSSGGPRNGDAFLKPDVTAPGVSVISTFNGSGNAGTIMSGTSMASPHNAGAAALVRQARPDWSVADIKAAIVNTADPGLNSAAGAGAYRISRGGTGTIQPAKSTTTDIVAYANGGSKFDVAVSFGFEELQNDLLKTGVIRLDNNGASDASFNIAQALPQGSPHTITLGQSSVTVPAGGHAIVEFQLDVPAATAGSASASGLSFREVAGLITFTPATASDNHSIALRVPYYLVQRPTSKIDAKVAPGTRLAPGRTTTINITNAADAPISGDADFYAWGLSDTNDGRGLQQSPADVRAIGVQSFPNPGGGVATRRLLVFAVNTWDDWFTPSTQEFDIHVDVDPQNNNGDDYIVVAADQGAVQTGTSNGVLGAFVFSPRSAGAAITFLTSAPTNGSTALIPINSTMLCRGDNPATPANDPEPCLNSASVPGGRFTYHAFGFDLNDGGADEVEGMASYYPWGESITTGDFQSVAPGASATSNVSINAAEWAMTPALGAMVVTKDNKNGKDEATLIEAKKK
jgi:minor extracellular serine protease Vpr